METLRYHIQQLILLAGLAQVGLVAGSLAIPAILKWKMELAKVQPLIKQMFWTYAGYILMINLCFGVLSVFDYQELTDGSHLSVLVNAFIAAYWISRILIQFFYFDRDSFPKGNFYLFGEIMLVTLFVFLSAVYSFAFYIDLNHN